MRTRPLLQLFLVVVILSSSAGTLVHAQELVADRRFVYRCFLRNMNKNDAADAKVHFYIGNASTEKFDQLPPGNIGVILKTNSFIPSLN